VLSPEEALQRYLDVKKRAPNITVAGIAGPGDALANVEETLKTVRLIREADHNILFCLSTNGLLLPRYAEQLHAAGVSHITVTVNALDTVVAKRIYRHIDYEGKRYIREEAAKILLANQFEGIKKVCALGMVCKVNIVMLKGLNDAQIPPIVARVKDAGASLSNIMQLIPVGGTLFENIPLVSREELNAVRKQCETILPQMYHCRQCRADAAGLLDADISDSFTFPAVKNTIANVNTVKPLLFAIATKNDIFVDKHFGQADVFSIYEYKNGKINFVEHRSIPQYCKSNDECGAHTDKIQTIINTIIDCDAVLVMRIGEVPRHLLGEKGIKVIMTYDYIENAIRDAGDSILPLTRAS
jgi:MoaA/NifB/PqqE/SkfB family radical SAM enzyme